MEKGVLQIPEEFIGMFLSEQKQEDISNSIASYLHDKEKGFMYWVVTEDIQFDVIPEPFLKDQRLRLIVPSILKSKTCLIVGCLVFCPDDISNKEAIKLSQKLMNHQYAN